MKKTLYVLLALLSLSSCATKTSQDDNTDYGISDLPLGMYLTVIDYKDGVLTLEIDNQSGYEMTYTEDFTLEIKKDGEWEVVPLKEGALIVDSTSTIKDLEKNTVTYDLNDRYESLEKGTYRISQEDMSAEFTIN